MVVFGMSFVGCGGRDDGRGVEYYLENRELLYGTTITIAYAPVFIGRGAEHFGIPGLAAAYMIANPGITIEVRNFANAQRMREIVSVELMAGQSDTLIDSRALDWGHMGTSRFFVNWFDIMSVDLDFNEDDWFMNVFNAFANDDGLFVFPKDFYFEVLMANGRAGGLAEAVDGYDFLSPADLHRLHAQFACYRYAHLFPHHSTFWAVMYNLPYFLDIPNGFVGFQSDSFIDFISHARGISDLAIGQMPLAPYGVELITIHDRPDFGYLFWRNSSPQNLQPFFDYEYDRSQLGSYALLTNANNELIINNFAPAFALSQGATAAQMAVAWDFIQFMQNPENVTNSIFWNSHIHSQPIHRPLFYRQIDIFVPEQISRIGNFLRMPIDMSMENPRNHYITSISATLKSIADLPMRHIESTPRAISIIIQEVLEQFHDGLIDARQAAEYLQNRITIVLMEMD